MKKLIVLIVILSILYFVFGFIAVIIGWVPKETYLTLSAIIGGVASACGLLSFGIARKISNEDIENIEIAYFKKVSETADELKRKNDELILKANELSTC